MTIRNTPIRLTLACLGTALLLTACTTPSPEAGRPNTSAPTTSSPPAPSTTPSTSTPSTAIPTAPPERPAAANGLTLAAAEAFYRHYVELLNYASQTGDTSALLAASDSGCGGCKEFANYVAKVNEANGGFRGDYRERVKEVSELTRGEGGRIGGSAVVAIGTYTTKESPSATPFVTKAAEYTEQIALSPSGTNWVMYEMKLERR